MTIPSVFPYKRIKNYTDRVGTYEDSSTGMTLRDYFAGQALTGMLSVQKTVDALHLAHKDSDDEIAQDGLAEICYQLADAMLKEREGK